MSLGWRVNARTSRSTLTHGATAARAGSRSTALISIWLVDDHESICERLRTTGDFVFYSSQNGPLFEDEA